MTAVICCCGWSGDLRTYDPCPACERLYTYRVTARRLESLRAVVAQSNAALEPAMRSSLLRLGLVRLISGRPPPNHSERHTASQRHHAVTPAGAHVLDVVAGILAEQTRHDVAASVARHAGLDGAPATHRIVWLDGSRRYSHGCGLHLALDPAAPPRRVERLASRGRQ